MPEAERNDTASYLAQRTQLGSGNTREAVSPRNPPTTIPIPHQDGVADGNSLTAGGDRAGSPDERVIATNGWSTHVRYLSDAGNEGQAPERPILLQAQPASQAGPEDETGPAALTGPRRDELWVTPDTRAATLAPYLDAWRRKVEHVGTINYPTAARSPGARGNPVVEVAIGADGRLERTLIRRTSGDPALDNAALEILKLASPFDPFPPELARERSVLRFVYEYQFSGGRLNGGAVSTVP